MRIGEAKVMVIGGKISLTSNKILTILLYMSYDNSLKKKKKHTYTNQTHNYIYIFSFLEKILLKI